MSRGRFFAKEAIRKTNYVVPPGIILIVLYAVFIKVSISSHALAP